MDSPNGGAAQVPYPLTWLAHLMPLGSYGLHIGEGAGFSYIHPHFFVDMAEYRPRIESLSGLHVTALAAYNPPGPTGPEGFGGDLVQWLASTSDALIVNCRDVVGDTAATLEAILRPARRAFLVMTGFEHQQEWAEALSAQAAPGAIVHRLFIDAEGRAA